ncbi:MAG: DUF6600 domain-containing protein, partial [Terracidiphilus sp.]
MLSRSASAATALLSALLFATTLTAQTTDAVLSTPGASKIRIVRLSEVRGAVRLDRTTGRGFESAMANLPIVEKNRLRTDQGVAEVEFEDNSTLRVGPNSVVEFPQLERNADGATVSTVHLVRGIAYVSLVRAKGNNQFNLLFDRQNAALPAGSHIRLETDETRSTLAVLDGSVRVEGQAGSTEIGRKETATFHPADQARPDIEKKVAAESFDEWDKDATGYHARTAAMSALSSAPYSYGLNDMAYYGSFMNAGGCGTMWQPYFVSADWSPYSNGAFAYYPGAGYSWVSPYPWAWTPYHYGSWSMCPGVGWGWQPGGAWNGINNVAGLTGTGIGSGAAGPIRFHPPAAPPQAGASTLVLVNEKPLVRNEVASGDSFVFRKDSAGLGIPRDTLGKLDKFSHQAVQRGTSNMHIYFSAPTMSATAGRAPGSNVAPVSIHRGYAGSESGSGQIASNGAFVGSHGTTQVSSAPSV